MVAKIVNVVCFLALTLSTEGANILGFFPIPSVSHQSTFQPIWRELALRGHQVTAISPNILRENITNLREIDIGFVYEYILKSDISKKLSKENTFIENLNNALSFFERLFEGEFRHPEVSELIKSNDHHFDVILVESISPMAYAFAGKYKAPVVGISSLGASLSGHDAVGNPTHPVISPDIILTFEGEMTFWDRLESFLFNIYLRVVYHWYWLPRYDQIIKKHFGDGIPHLGDLERNVSLMLVNVNHLMHTPRPNVPAVVEISQIHIKPKKPLPDDIKMILDESKEGVIYFSLGSNVKSVNLPNNTLEHIKRALGELPYTVLWKWESDVLPGKPDNVITRKWLPQQDILGHPNIKAFVTQGGIQSIEEAITNGVPMVGMPFFGDQPINIAKLANLGIARGLNPTTVTAEALKEAILDVAQNQTYKRNVLEARTLLTDQPMVGVEKAVWWIEYVIRHKGAKHLVSPSRDMPLWKYLCLDVIGFLSAVIAIFLYSIRRLVSLGLSSKFKIKYKNS